VTGLTPGDSYTFTVTATSAGGTSDPSAPSNPVTIDVSQAPQAPLIITSTAGIVGTDLALTTSGGSGTGAIGYTTADGTAAGCAVHESALSVTGAGTCIVTATKAGDGDYLPISSDRTTVTFTAVLIAQAITFTSTPPGPAVVGGPSYTVAATGGDSGNPVTFSLDKTSSGCALDDTTVTFPAAGTCVIDADQAGDDTHRPAPQQRQTFQVVTGSACSSAPFPDVAVSNAFCGDIAWLAGQGIAAGYADGGFHPTAPVSRQAMAAFLHRLPR
jgi:hypothetical protein